MKKKWKGFEIKEIDEEMEYQRLLKNLLEDYVNLLLRDTSSTIFLKGDESYVNMNSSEKKSLIVNLNKVNDFGKISKYFREVNKQLSTGGIFVGHFQSHCQLKQSQKIYSIPLISSIYKLFDFGINRVIPKLKITRCVYSFLTRGKNRKLSKAEVLGRLVRFGFSIEKIQEIDNHFYFVVKKVNDGITNDKPSYGPFYKMPRIGQNGKLINVYKLRTMHPYSEYLHDYILKQNGYGSSGKPANDFRLTSWGKIARKYWLDEIPQLINVLKGDMKLLGVRPVSRRYFEDIPEHMQHLRLSQKPGCIPPYVALNKANSKNDVLRAEEIYLRLSRGRATKLDLQLTFMAIKNILFKGKRSA